MLTNFKQNNVPGKRNIEPGRYRSPVTGNAPHPTARAYVNDIVDKKRHLINIKAVAMATPKNKTSQYFNKVILRSDTVTDGFISWVKKYLAVNGHIIQIYTDLNYASNYFEKNERAFRKYISPTHFHTGYYQSYGEDDGITLTPYLPSTTHTRKNHSEKAIEFVNTRTGLSAAHINPHPSQTVCIDHDKSDVMHLHIFLTNLANQTNMVDGLLANPVLPYLSSLCRWERGYANCEHLDTVIVDSEQHVKTCWTGRPVGKVGVPLPVIAENIKKMRMDAEKKRGCGNCGKNKTCTRCVFPQPLSAGEYCHLKRISTTERVSSVVQSLDPLKEI
ncbi:MAG: hypothetical protein GY950_31645 [bacterium]|nr:hypothetical protein [bacterium]